jgi:hypothetical protein
MAENPIRLEFGTSSDPGRDGADAGPMHWNCYVEPVTQGKHQAPLHASDGLTSFATVTNGGLCRGLIEMGGAVYGVFGTVLGRVSTAGTVTEIGGIPGTSKVSLAHNDASPRQLVVVADGNRYVVTNDVLADLTDPDLPPPVSVTFLNQRIIFGIADGRVFFSAVDDATSISSLDFFTAEGNPDTLIAVVAHLQEVWVFGAESIEVWRDTGNATAPFRRNEAGVIPKGCLGQATIAELDNDIFWVGNDGVVYKAAGYQFQPISTFGVNEAIRATTDKASIEALAFHMAGHAFYVLSGPDWTWAYNRTTGTWDPRFSYALDRWRVSQAVAFGDKVILGDYATNAVYQLSRTSYDEAGTTMIWRARTAPMHAYPNQISVDALHCDFVLGVGLVSANAHESTPQVGMRYSDDGGYTWSNQRLVPLGATGVRTVPVRWWGLGVTGRTGRIWELEASSPVVRTLMYAAVEGDVIGG